MQSLDEQFNGNANEVLEEIRLRGYFFVERKRNVGHIALKKWAVKKTGDPNFGTYPVLTSGHPAITAKELVATFEARVDELKNQNQILLARIHELELKNQYYEGQQAIEVEGQIASFMGKC